MNLHNDDDNANDGDIHDIIIMLAYNLHAHIMAVLYWATHTNIHGHNTRHSHDPHINTRRTETLSHSFIHKAPAL